MQDRGIPPWMCHECAMEPAIRSMSYWNRIMHRIIRIIPRLICHPMSRRLTWFRTISRIKHIERSWSFCDRRFKSSCRLQLHSGKLRKTMDGKLYLSSCEMCDTMCDSKHSLSSACLQPVPLLLVEAFRWSLSLNPSAYSKHENLLAAKVWLDLKDVHGVVSHKSIWVNHGSDPNAIKAHSLSQVTETWVLLHRELPQKATQIKSPHTSM